MNCIMQSISPTKAPFKATQCFRHSLLTNPCLRLALIFALLVATTSARNLAQRLEINQRRRLPGMPWSKNGKIKRIRQIITKYNLSLGKGKPLEEETKEEIKNLLLKVNALEDFHTMNILNSEIFLKEDSIKMLCSFSKANRLKVASSWKNKLCSADREYALPFLQYYCNILKNGSLDLGCKKKYRQFLKQASGYDDMVTVFNDYHIVNEDVETIPNAPVYAIHFVKLADETQRNEFNEVLQTWIQPRKSYFCKHYEPAKLENLIKNLKMFLRHCGYEKHGQTCDYALTAALGSQLFNWKYIYETMERFIRTHRGYVNFYQYFEDEAPGSQEKSQLNAIVLKSGHHMTFPEAVQKYTSEGGAGAHFFYKQIWEEVREEVKLS